MDMVTGDMVKTDDIDREALAGDYQTMLASVVVELRRKAAQALGVAEPEARALPMGWVVIAHAAAGLIDRNDQTIAKVKAACTDLARLQFPMTLAEGLGDYMRIAFCANDYLGDFGEVFWRALVWAFGDDLITQAEAAKIAGTTTANIGQHTRLTFVYNPDANQRQARRMVLRSEVEAIEWKKGRGD